MVQVNLQGLRSTTSAGPRTEPLAKRNKNYYEYTNKKGVGLRRMSAWHVSLPNC